MTIDKLISQLETLRRRLGGDAEVLAEDWNNDFFTVGIEDNGNVAIVTLGGPTSIISDYDPDEDEPYHNAELSRIDKLCGL